MTVFIYLFCDAEDQTQGLIHAAYPPPLSYIPKPVTLLKGTKPTNKDS
jgi:hypothetical protein